MGKISKALEKAQKEREQRQQEQADKSIERVDESTVHPHRFAEQNENVGTGSSTSPEKEPATNTGSHPDRGVTPSELKPRIHDPELHRIKVRRRSPYHPSNKKKAQYKMMALIVLSVIALLSIFAYIYVQLNDDPFEKVVPVEEHAVHGQQTTVHPHRFAEQNENVGTGSLQLTGKERSKSIPVTDGRGLTTDQSAQPSTVDRRLTTNLGDTPRSMQTSRDIIVQKIVDIEPVKRVVETRDVIRQPVVVPVKPTLIASFNSGRRLNNIGGAFRTWTDNDSYPCNDYFDSINARLGKGYALRLEYNVESTEQVRNGLLMDCANIPIKGNEAFVFYMKGDTTVGFTTSVVVALESSHRTRTYMLNNVNYRWEKVAIPLEYFNEPGETLKEFRFIFQSDLVTKQSGAVFIDDVELERK